LLSGYYTTWLHAAEENRWLKYHHENMQSFATFVLKEVTFGKPESVLCFVHQLRSTVTVVMQEIVLRIVQVGA
jgi:hypothetical protein